MYIFIVAKYYDRTYVLFVVAKVNVARDLHILQRYERMFIIAYAINIHIISSKVPFNLKVMGDGIY